MREKKVGVTAGGLSSLIESSTCVSSNPPPLLQLQAVLSSLACSSLVHSTMNKKLLLGSFFDGRLHLLLLLVGGQLVVGQEGCCAVKEVQGERKEKRKKKHKEKKQDIKHKIKNNIKLQETVIPRAPET